MAHRGEHGAAVVRHRGHAGGSPGGSARDSAPSRFASGLGAAHARERQRDGRGHARWPSLLDAARHDGARIITGRLQADHTRKFQPGESSMLPEHRAERVAAVSVKRARRYLQRQHFARPRRCGVRLRPPRSESYAFHFCSAAVARSVRRLGTSDWNTSATSMAAEEKRMVSTDLLTSRDGSRSTSCCAFRRGRRSRRWHACRSFSRLERGANSNTARRVRTRHGSRQLEGEVRIQVSASDLVEFEVVTPTMTAADDAAIAVISEADVGGELRLRAPCLLDDRSLENEARDLHCSAELRAKTVRQSDDEGRVGRRGFAARSDR